MLEQRIQQQFFDSADLQYAAAEALARPVAEAAQALVGCLTAGGKVLAWGSGASAGISGHVAAQLVGRFERDRPGLAAVALAAQAAPLGVPADSDGAAQAVARQVQALGAPGDVLLAIATDGRSPVLLAALRAARAKDMPAVVLVGGDAAKLREALAETDVLIAVAHPRAARVHEVHLLVAHCLCDAVDLQLLGEEEGS